MFRIFRLPESQFVRVHHVGMVEAVLAHLEMQVIADGLADDLPLGHLGKAVWRYLRQDGGVQRGVEIPGIKPF